MENENLKPVGDDRSWSSLLLIVILVIGSLVAIQIADLVVRDGGAEVQSPDSGSSILQGDFYIKYALVFGGEQKKQYAHNAIQFYEKAAPSPGAYRRIGLTRETLLNESGWNAFEKIDSQQTVESFSSEMVKDYHAEVRLWRDIYGPGEFNKSRLNDYISRIKKLPTGPLQELAIADVYDKAGDAKKAAAWRGRAVRDAQMSVYPFLAIVGALFITGLVGLILAILFLVNYAKTLDDSPRPSIQYPILFLTFLAYMMSYIALGVVIALVMELAGVDMATRGGLLTGVVLQLVVMICSLALGLSALWIMTAFSREDPRAIGYVRVPWDYAVTWGAGGFAAILPFFAVAYLVSIALSNTVFRNVPTPENDVVQFLVNGSPGIVVLTVLMAVIVAPIVEETFFRGALYGALRARMSVWGAAALSAAMFAAIHPLPGHFLPILVIGTVLALIREKTGSLLPCMICHGIYNGVIMLFALLAN